MVFSRIAAGYSEGALGQQAPGSGVRLCGTVAALPLNRLFCEVEDTWGMQPEPAAMCRGRSRRIGVDEPAGTAQESCSGNGEPDD